MPEDNQNQQNAVTLVEISEKVSGLAEEVRRLSLDSQARYHKSGTFAADNDLDGIEIDDDNLKAVSKKTMRENLKVTI